MSLNGDELSALLAAFARSNTGKEDVLSDPWRQNPFVRSGVSALYRIIKGVRAKAVVGSKDSEEAKDAPSTHPLYALLSKPGPACYGSELWAQVVAYKKLDGHAFVLLYSAVGWWTPELGDWPREMQTIDTRCVRYEDADIDRVTGAVRQWRIRTRWNTEVIVPSVSIMHFRDFDPRDAIGCSSPLDPVWSGMEADLNVDQYSRAWLKNRGALGDILKTTINLSEIEREAVLRAWADRHEGASKAGKTAILGPDIDLKPANAQTAKDMEMPSLRAWNRDVVKAVLAVTDFEVGRVADYNRANSESARTWLWQNTILPELEDIESVFWGHVAEPLSRNERVDTWLKFDVDKVAALRPQLAESAPIAATLIGAGYDPAQVSEKLDLGLDYTEQPDPSTSNDVANNANKTFHSFKTGPTIIVKKVVTTAIATSASLRLHRVWQRQAEKYLASRWRKFTTERYAETVRRVREIRDIGTAPDILVDRLIEPSLTWTNGASNAIGSAFMNLGRPLAKNLELELGGFSVLKVDDSLWKEQATRRIGQMIQVSKALRVRMRDSILKGMVSALEGDEGGFTITTIEDILKAKFEAVIPSNAMTVARTESGIFQNDVRNGLMKADGIEERSWLASIDQWTRDSHRAIDGEVRGMDERFSNGMMHPCESGAPTEEVINCRCSVSPRIKERS